MNEDSDSKLDTATDTDSAIPETEEIESGAGDSMSRDQTRVEPPSISSTYSHPREEGGEEPNEIRGYRILRLLGEGGMGEVFEAEQVGAVRRRVAIKVIKRGMDSRRIVNRFEAERQALAMMDHPGIARIFDAGLTEDHRPYFAMEYVEGVPITEYCDEHQLSIGRRVELFAQVCRAVQHAHLKGIIHRDLKPTNILVTLQDGEPVPKVIDFGLAKAMTEPLTEREMKTEMGQLLGTMEYMSPEQADLTGVDIDTRTDVYSLGVVLYQLLAGTLPFESKELMKGGYWRALQRIQEEEPERPSRKSSTAADPQEAAEKRHLHDAKELCKRLSGDLDWIVLRAVAKDRAERYETVNGLAMDLERHLNDEPVNAAQPSVRYRVGKFVRRHRVGVATGTLLLALIIAFGVVMAVQAKRIAEERDRANLEAATAEESLEFMVDIFEVVDPNEGRGSTVTAREVLDAGADQLRRRLEDQHLIRARLLDSIGAVYLSLGLISEAEPLLEEALAVRERELGHSSVEVAESLRRIAELRDFEGASREAESLAREALEILDGIKSGDPLERAEILRILGWSLLRQDKYSDAEPVLEKALQIRQNSLPDDDPKVAESLYDLGVAIWQQKSRYDQVGVLLHEALEIYEAKFGPRYIRIRAILNILAGLARTQDRQEEATRLQRRALEITEEVLGPNSRRLAIDLNNLAIHLDSLGNSREAEPLVTRSLEIYERTIGTEHQEYGTALGTLAWVQYRQGEYEAAERHFETALRILLDTVGEDSDSVATLRRDFAVMLGELEREEQALELIDQALETREDLYDENHSSVGDCLIIRAKLASRLGDGETAIKSARRALAILVSAYGEGHPTVKATRELLANWERRSS